MTHEEAVKMWQQRGRSWFAPERWVVDATDGMLDILARHVRVEAGHDSPVPYCDCCDGDWPCPDARACGVTE